MDELYEIAREEADAIIGTDELPPCDGTTDYWLDMLLGRMVDEAVKAMRKTAQDYRDGYLKLRDTSA